MIRSPERSVASHTSQRINVAAWSGPRTVQWSRSDLCRLNCLLHSVHRVGVIVHVSRLWTVLFQQSDAQPGVKALNGVFLHLARVPCTAAHTTCWSHWRLHGIGSSKPYLGRDQIRLPGVERFCIDPEQDRHVNTTCLGASLINEAKLFQRASQRRTLCCFSGATASNTHDAPSSLEVSIVIRGLEVTFVPSLTRSVALPRKRHTCTFRIESHGQLTLRRFFL